MTDETPDPPAPAPSHDPDPPADNTPPREGEPAAGAPSDKDPYADAEDAGRGEIVVYSLGGVIDEFTTSGFRNLNTLLLIAFQLNPLILGLITAVKTIWDGVMDPIVAHISDNSRSRFGRRRPFILAGGIVMALVAWITWEFMPSNDKLRPNDPVVPEVYHADELRTQFADVLLAYGVDDFDLRVTVADDSAALIPADLLRTFADDTIKSLSKEAKALVRLRAEAVADNEPTGEKGPEFPVYTATLRVREASNPVVGGPREQAPLPFRAILEVTLTGARLASPVTTVVNVEAVGATLTDAEREIPVLESFLYTLIGDPEEGGLYLRYDDGASSLELNALEHRLDERAVMASLQLGLMDALSQAFGLPYWRILPAGATVGASTREAIRRRAMDRLAAEPDLLQALMVSAGAKLNLQDEVLTAREQTAIATFREQYPNLNDIRLYEELYDGIVIDEGASYHALQRDPRGTRQFKGIWEKITSGLAAYTEADAEQERQFIWFVAAMFLLMAIGQTLYSAAYYAQGIEIAPSYNGRTLVVAYRSVTNTLINFLTTLFLPLSLMPLFMDAREGSLFLVYILSPIGIALAILVFFGTRERTVVIRSEKQRGPGFFRSVREIGGNLEFWRILGMYVFMGYAIGSFQGLGNFLSIYYVFDGNMVAGASYGSLAGMIATLLAFATIPLYVWLCKRFGKHNALRLALTMLALASMVKYFCYNPEYPELLFIPPLLYSPAIAIFYKVLASMMGDVTDYDELLHGERREGMFGAVMAIIMKTLGAFTALATGVVIVISGFEQGKGVHQDPGVFHTMLVLYSIVPGIAALGGFLILYKFKLTADRVREIKAMLARQRRAKAEKIAREEAAAS